MKPSTLCVTPDEKDACLECHEFMNPVSGPRKRNIKGTHMRPVFNDPLHSHMIAHGSWSEAYFTPRIMDDHAVFHGLNPNPAVYVPRGSSENLPEQESDLLTNLAGFCDKAQVGLPVDVWYEEKWHPCAVLLSRCFSYLTFIFDGSSFRNGKKPNDIIVSIKWMKEGVVPDEDHYHKFDILPDGTNLDNVLLLVDKYLLVYLRFENKMQRENFRTPIDFFRIEL